MDCLFQPLEILSVVALEDPFHPDGANRQEGCPPARPRWPDRASHITHAGARALRGGRCSARGMRRPLDRSSSSSETSYPGVSVHISLFTVETQMTLLKKTSPPGRENLRRHRHAQGWPPQHHGHLHEPAGLRGASRLRGLAAGYKVMLNSRSLLLHSVRPKSLNPNVRQ